ncbi:Acyl-CoA-binding protein [Plasmopara halstedii]|uniref:Acyl-CoA-binding protein n=1 Tax=Plasmopara halstedii TaxID=4781 RepID=A0A0P1A940_PLAHL|nr:Acyl-CoA-binding protein [Plasmopara halstedii]CEG37236.1 Acyl-CoA-binding protein [Plasmopara halstedii]|eukprot:XP_024573605.1 Acyl-CoA-binding protein [Plasmopara halstedii]
MRSNFSKRIEESQSRKRKQEEKQVDEDEVPVVFKDDQSLVQLHAETTELLKLVKTTPKRTEKLVQSAGTVGRETLLNKAEEVEMRRLIDVGPDQDQAVNIVEPSAPFSFSAEETRVRQGKDTFYPDMRPSRYSVEWQKSKYERERNRQEEIKLHERLKLDQQMRNRQQKRGIVNRLDKSATLIQATFRGFWSRQLWNKRQHDAEAAKKNNEVKTIADQWHEVRDIEHNEVWYYNATTGISQWEPPTGSTSNSAFKVSASLPVLHKKSSTNNVVQTNQQRPVLGTKESDTLPSLSPSCSSARSTASDQEQQYQLSGSHSSKYGQILTNMPQNLPVLKPEGMPLYLNAWDCTSVLSSERSAWSEQQQDDNRESRNEEKELLYCRERAHFSQSNEERDDEGDDMNSDWQMTDTFFRADGSKNSNLRDTIRKALHVSKFDSISSLLASKVALRRKAITKQSRHRNASLGTRREIVLGKREQPVFVAVLARPEGNQFYSESTQTLRKKASKVPHIRDLADPGFYDQRVRQSRVRENSTQQDDDIEVTKARQEAVRICFNCWCASKGQLCDLHQDPNEAIRKVRSADSALMCGNWELDQLRRKYRAEEIQEVFRKRQSCLRYDHKSKQFITVTECRHPIYRTIEQLSTKWNKTMRRKLHTRAWFRSFIEQIRINHLPKALQSDQSKSQSHSFLILKNTLENARWVSKYSESVRDFHPKAPITEKNYGESHSPPKRDVIMIDPARPEISNWILVTEYLKPTALYKPRVYEVPPPRCVPMPIASFVNRVSLPAHNIHIEAGRKASWLERVSGSLAIAAVRNALLHLEMSCPLPGSTNVKRSKCVQPCVMLFATFSRKPCRGNMDIGGLSAQLLIHMLVTTYIPAQFGNLIVFDRHAVLPLPSSNENAAFACLDVDLITPVYVERPLEHALNHRRPPCIVLTSNELCSATRQFPLNRPEQTGEEESHGFRTFWLSDPLPVSDIVSSAYVVPTNAILSPNLASLNPTFTTHVDRKYQFCVPTTRANTPVEFLHLLWIGRSSRNQPQTFTTLSRQQPGEFMIKANSNGALGPCATVVYRSWAYLQDSPFDEFVTEDGIAYWYDRKTGDTFWTRPILPAEKFRGKDGDIDGVVTTGEGEVATPGTGLVTPQYSQENLRKYITQKMEAPEEMMRRVKSVSASAKKHEIVVDIMPAEASSVVKKGELQRIQVPQLSIKRDSTRARSVNRLTKSQGRIAGDCSAETKIAEETAMPSLDENTKQMIDSITQALESAFPALNQGLGATKGANVDMLQLGIGLGMGLGMRVQQQNISPSKLSAAPRQPSLVLNQADEDEQIEDSERSETISEVSSRSACSIASIDISPTPDLIEVSEGPHVGKKTPGYITHAMPEVKTLQARKPVDERDKNTLAVDRINGTCDQRLSNNFMAAVSSTKTCRMYANYLPISKNINQPKSVGSVRPRKALDDWLPVEYSPWSAGRSLFGTQFIDDLIFRPELVSEPEMMKPVTTKVTVQQAKKTDVVSQAAKEKEQLDTLFSLCRHGKYDEIELLLNSPDWSSGIDVTDVNGNTLLSIACQNNNKRIAKLCLRRGADINTQNLNGQSLLHYCHEYGFHDLMEYLLDKGARDDLLNKEGLTCYEGLSQEAVDAI